MPLAYNEETDEYVEISTEVKPCYSCKHRYWKDAAHYCNRPRVEVIDIIQGVSYIPPVSKLRLERFSTSPFSCGIEGKFWEPV